MQLTQSCTVNDPTRPAGRVGFGKLDPRSTLADLQQRLPWITIKKSKELPDRTVSRAVTFSDLERRTRETSAAYRGRSYSCLYRLTQTDQIRHGNRCKSCFVGQPTQRRGGGWAELGSQILFETVCMLMPFYRDEYGRAICCGS